MSFNKNYLGSNYFFFKFSKRLAKSSKLEFPISDGTSGKFKFKSLGGGGSTVSFDCFFVGLAGAGTLNPMCDIFVGDGYIGAGNTGSGYKIARETNYKNKKYFQRDILKLYRLSINSTSHTTNSTTSATCTTIIIVIIFWLVQMIKIIKILIISDG